MNLLIITPIYSPATGGAATYYDILTRLLLDNKIVKSIIVLTEKVPGQKTEEIGSDRRLIIKRVFPHRAGGNNSKIVQYIKYMIQNIQYWLILYFIRKFNIDICLVHSSFHNYLNMMYHVVASRNNRHTKWIADVRDWQLPYKSLKELSVYHGIIACSDNVYAHLARNKDLLPKIAKIPVIHKLDYVPLNEEIESFREKYNLINKKYISYLGLIKKQKNIELLIESFCLIVNEYPDYYLVMAGINKDSSIMDMIMNRCNNIIYIGELSHRESILLTAGSVLSVNLSYSEGMPRSSLEALSLGIQTVLPPNIPEFERCCPQNVMKEHDPIIVAEKIKKLLKLNVERCYPLNNHYPENVLEKYQAMFDKVISE